MSKRTRFLLLGIAALLLAGALAWRAGISRNSPLAALTGELAQFGYTVREEDLYLAYAQSNASIRAALADTDLDAAVAASRAAGFPSDIDAVGYIEAVLVALQNRDVITLFLRDGALELAFVQRPASALVYALGAQP